MESRLQAVGESAVHKPENSLYLIFLMGPQVNNKNASDPEAGRVVRAQLVRHAADVKEWAAQNPHWLQSLASHTLRGEHHLRRLH